MIRPDAESNPGQGGPLPPGDGREAPRVLAGNTACASCGYLLKGLAADGVCPECGASVRRSVHGDLLVYASREYLAKLRRGALVVVVGTVVGTFGLVAYFIVRTKLSLEGERPVEVLDVSVRVGSSVLTLLGWWWLSSPDPGKIGPDQDLRSRRVLRGVLAANLAASLGELVTSLVVIRISGGERFRVYGGAVVNLFSSRSWASPAHAIMAVAAATILVLWAVQLIASILYVRSLARRVPNPGLASFAAVCLWLVLPAFTILTLLTCGVSALLGIVLYLVLIVWVYLALRRVPAMP